MRSANSAPGSTRDGASTIRQHGKPKKPVRLTIPQDVLDRIALTALPRSSIIVSDEPLSRETNYNTEFVAVLNSQPQGGFLMRRPTVNVRVASRNDWGFGFFFQRNWNSQPANRRQRAGQYYQPMQQRWW